MVDDEWVRSSLNKKGVMVKQFSNVSQAFIRDAASATHDLIDMGCAYGIATLPILEMKKHIIACDLEQQHLDILQAETPKALLPFLSLKQGCFPYDYDFKSHSISGIHCSYIFHFLKGGEVIEGIKKSYDWLIPGGKLYINTATPYLNWLNFIDEFKRKEALGERFPGEIDIQNMGQFIHQEKNDLMPGDALPDFFHVFTIKSFSSLLEGIGFVVEDSHYFDIHFPDELDHFFGGNGRGILGIIASKPR
ncbi:class I SAM-dependent methyltransferase [uncultured Shewanella sp.]|uniref:methyltransferase domain-containing protein n=1 Tax=uncultured Shewanella sp. TaxID=173975 RepID=UPI002630EB6A|nr:class I SAM-dependent methyltransferase [uncultured Shewanella sp.]